MAAATELLTIRARSHGPDRRYPTRHPVRCHARAAATAPARAAVRPPGRRSRAAGRRTSGGRRAVCTIGVDRARPRPRRRAPKCCWLVRPPPGTLPLDQRRARPSAAGPPPRRSPASTPLAVAISVAWPIRPKPVTSVQAWTVAGRQRRAAPRAAARFSVHHRRDRRVRRPPAGARSNLIAVAMTPVPIGLVRNSTSPGRAPALVQIRAGSTSPVTA